MKNLLPASQGGDEHNQRAFREMEVGNQRVNAAEAIAGINENVCPARSGTKRPVLIGEAFQCTAGGGTYCNDPPAISMAAVYFLGGFLGDSANSECMA